MRRGSRRLSTPTDVEFGNESETTDSSEATSSSSSVFVGSSYYVTWRNGQIQPATVVDKRIAKKKLKQLDNDQESFEYYVHYINYDRRLDEWVTLDRIDLNATCVEIENGQSSPRSKSGTKKMKRKLEDMSGAQSLRDDKLALLSNLEKEYEEITKVKNIQTIEMGRFEIGLLTALVYTLVSNDDN